MKWRLSSLFLVLAIIAVACGWFADRQRLARERDAAQSVAKQGLDLSPDELLHVLRQVDQAVQPDSGRARGGDK